MDFILGPCFWSQFEKLGVLELHCVSHSVCLSVRPSVRLSAVKSHEDVISKTQC